MIAFVGCITAPVSPRRRTANTHPTRGRSRLRLFPTWSGFAILGLLIGCASAPSGGYEPPPETTAIAERWHAPLPHSGQLANLSQWWAQFDDPLMLRLIEAGQRVSPTLAQASALIADAQAARISQRSAQIPTVDARAEVSRAQSAVGDASGTAIPSTASSASLQVGWELDLFGAGRAAASAAQSRLAASQAAWHDARVSVAAEVALTYLELRACEAQVQLAERDASSRAQTARITRLAADAGFRPPAAAELATASAAQGNLVLLQQRMQCDLLIKTLTGLTAQDETTLRLDLVTGTGQLPRPVELGVAVIPADVLSQRPDIRAAAFDVLAASADSKEARARRWPSITLAGNIGTTRIANDGGSTSGTAWSFGPLTVTLPLFDGGTRRANAEAALARYEAATIVYSARLREAIRDVEVALVKLDSSAKRGETAAVAAAGYGRSFEATEASYQVGMASLFELEDARREMVAAQSAVIELQRERISAWIDLYRALGGGWPIQDSPQLSDVR